MTLEDWTKLLDVALRDTQHTCVTLTEVPETAQDLRSLIDLAHAKASECGLSLSKIELPLERYGDTADFPGAVGTSTDVVRMTFAAASPLTHGRRIVLLSRHSAQPFAKPAQHGRARGSARRAVGQRRLRDHATQRGSDLR